jgi:hypothetical protein
MKYSESCPHCSKKLTAYTLPLNKGLVGAFAKFAEAFIANGRVPLKKGLLTAPNSIHLHPYTYPGTL